MFKWLFIFFLNLCLCFSANALENLSLGKSYSYSPKPNYPLCTDDSDKIQLTDGKSSGSKWTEKSTVGWRKPEPAVEITIDLGQNCAVDQVNVHTVGGGTANVEFPEFISVLLSDTGSQFKFAGMISDRNLSKIRGIVNRGVPRIMRIENINASGRFVKLITRPNGINLFMDEIEVLGEKLSISKKQNLRNNLEVFDANEKLLSRIDDYLQLADNITNAKETIQSDWRGLSGQERKQVLSSLEKSAERINVSTTELLKANQIQDEKMQTGIQKARIYEDIYKKPFVCLPVNPMDILSEKEMLLNQSTKEIAIKLWQNEYESAAFDIINCSDKTMKMSVSVSPLLGTGEQRIDGDETFTIRKAEYVTASQIGSIADALVLLGDKPFNIEPGQIIQIWLTVYNPKLTEGDYRAKIAVSSKYDDGKELPIETIPVNLKIYKNRFPEKTSLNTCVWDYYDISSVSEIAKDLGNHHTNVCVIPAQDLPFLRFASDLPSVVRKPDYSKLDKIISQHKYAQTFLLGMSFNDMQKDFGRFGNVKWMSPAWKSVFTSWLKDLVAHLKTIGIGYNRFVLYPFDESISDEYYELAKLIKSIDPMIWLYANTFGKGPDEFMRFRELIDIWCLQESYISQHPDWYKTIKDFKKQMWTYECLEPMKAQSPYSYYRLLPWRAFQREQSGAGFWIYYYGPGFEPGAVPWNDTLRPHGFSGVVYGAKSSPIAGLTENIIPSRRWEAWREGVEDYQYLYELQLAINKIRVKDAKTAEKVQKILDDQVNRVLSNPDKSNYVYEAREILTDTLQKM
jgi:hypothetical protein